MAARVGVTREQLIEVYNEMDPNVKRAMADLPPEDFYRRLMREHMLRTGPQKGPWMGGGGDKPPGPPATGIRRPSPRPAAGRGRSPRQGDAIADKHDDGRGGRNDKDRGERHRND